MKYRIIDTHCHPQLPQFDVDRDAVVLRALTSGIGMVCVGTDFETSGRAIELTEKYEGIYASVGLHPNDNLDEEYNSSAYELLAKHPKVVAIGEIGLDYYRTTDDNLKIIQRARFFRQLDLAHSLNLPAIIHCRDAHEDMIALLSKYKLDFRDDIIPSVIHSFTGSVAQARSYIDEGFYIGLNAIATFSKNYKDMVQFIPIERLVLETDSPYLAPEPYRGKRNEPLYIEEVAHHIAAIRDITPEYLIDRTKENAQLLFSIKDEGCIYR